jgi:hypothetical protein
MKEKLLLLIQQQPHITAAALSAATGIGVDGVNTTSTSSSRQARSAALAPPKQGAGK